jgi:hypothetical protein
MIGATIFLSSFDSLSLGSRKSQTSTNSDKAFMNTIETKNPGSPFATPTYVWDRKDSGQVFVAQQAVAYGVKTFYGNAWSVPALMEMNDNENNGGYLCCASGQTYKSGDWKQVYADCLIQWSKYYATVGVNITHLGFLNEPENAYAPLSLFPFPLYFVLEQLHTVWV